MSTATAYPINYSEPRTIWSLSLQLIYTILAMLPFYYYLTNIVEVPAEGRYLLQYLPIAVGILLYFIQIQLNIYYWYEEKTFKKRDIFTAALRSLILTISMFYTIFFFILGWWVGNNGAYETELFSDVITRTMIQLGVAIGTIVVTVLLMQNIQAGSIPARKFTDRIRRRK